MHRDTGTRQAVDERQLYRLRIRPVIMPDNNGWCFVGAKQVMENIAKPETQRLNAR